ncbi:MAG: hemerythrin domain-containing protein [Verrucomicrobia bacterium]|nr:hemerythrin domain-containing protein [Verrucomicrobiota bacterium]
MKPTEILSSEHRVIEQVLDCLERIISEANADGRLDSASARDAISFFRTFADQCHHGKEEVHLFPAMEAKGFPRDGGPTGVMLAEHESGRVCVRTMSEAIDAAAEGDRAALRRFAEAGAGYIGLLRQHIEKEDHCLFSMANEVLTDEDQAELMAKFEKIETEHMGQGTHEKFLAIAEALAEKYGVQQKVAACAGHGMACCHH